MKVVIEFGTYAGGPIPDAVWALDTPENRGWFRAHAEALDPNSALFKMADPLSILWSVFEHHPAWTEIEVRGAELTTEIETEIALDSQVHSRDRDGFRLARSI